MGIELDVLVGHPEHDLLFIATQAMRVSGLKDPASRIRDSKRRGDVKDRKLASLMGKNAIKLPLDSAGRAIKKETLFATEVELYDMMLRGHSPQSEPFRKWVKEEVLPSIRKTGSYNAQDSQNPIAQAIMDELKSLRGEIVSLRQELQAKTFSLEAPKVAEVSLVGKTLSDSPPE